MDPVGLAAVGEQDDRIMLERRTASCMRTTSTVFSTCCDSWENPAQSPSTAADTLLGKCCVLTQDTTFTFLDTSIHSYLMYPFAIGGLRAISAASKQ